MGGRATFAIAGIAAAFVLAGAAAEVVLLPRAIPNGQGRLKDSPPPALSLEQLESLLERVARPLDPDLRLKLADAVLSESARCGYDPLFVLALVAVESR